MQVCKITENKKETREESTSVFYVYYLLLNK